MYEFANLNDWICTQDKDNKNPTSPITRAKLEIYNDAKEIKIGDLLTVKQFLKLYNSCEIRGNDQV